MVTERTSVEAEPLVAILIATLPDRAALLGLCLECVAAQTYPASRIKVYTDDRVGVSIGAKRNALWAQAKADGCAICVVFDDDDYHFPTRVAAHVEWFRRHPENQTCGSSKVHAWNGKLGRIERLRCGDATGTTVKDNTIAFRIDAPGAFADTSAGEANDLLAALRDATGDMLADVILYMRGEHNVSPWPSRGMREVRPSREIRDVLASDWFARSRAAVAA